MQHVGLSVNNFFQKFHEILIKTKKVLGPYMSKTNCLLDTGSAGTGSDKTESVSGIGFN